MALSSTRRQSYRQKMIIIIFSDRFLKRPQPRRAAIGTARSSYDERTESRRLITGEWPLTERRTQQHAQFHQSALNVPAGCDAAWDRPRHSQGVLAAGGRIDGSSSASHHPDLDYLKAVNSVAPPRDLELVFLLMAGYLNANLQGEGAEFFSARPKQFDS